jgi:hypothetical protein
VKVRIDKDVTDLGFERVVEPCYNGQNELQQVQFLPPSLRASAPDPVNCSTMWLKDSHIWRSVTRQHWARQRSKLIPPGEDRDLVDAHDFRNAIGAPAKT